MLGLLHRLHPRPPSPPVVYEWLARHWPSLMSTTWGSLIFAVAIMAALSIAVPMLLMVIVWPALGLLLSQDTSIAIGTVCTVAGLWWILKPVPGLWMWYATGPPAHERRRFVFDQLDNPHSFLALRVQWMLANRPDVALALAKGLARRRNKEIRPADVLWLYTQLEYPRHAPSQGPLPPSVRAQLEQWGLSAVVSGKALEKSVDVAVSAPVARIRF